MGKALFQNMDVSAGSTGTGNSFQGLAQKQTRIQPFGA
jgi:hypothetical protein